MRRLLPLLLLMLPRPLPAVAQPLPVTVSAEALRFAGGALEDNAGATGGRCLGAGWGANASDFAEASFTLAAAGDCSLGIRYAYDREQFLLRFPGTVTPHALRVLVDGRPAAGRTECPDTSHWTVFTYAKVPLGPLAAGPHTVRLEPDGAHNDLNIDHLVIGPADQKMDTRVATTLAAHSRHYRIRLSPRVDAARFPSRQVFAYLEAQYGFLRDYLGFEPPRTGLLTVVAPDDWKVGSSAFTLLGNVYLQEREIGTPGNNYAHEMFHFFEAGMDYATWWSEGMAYLIHVRSETELYGRPQAEIDRDLADLRDWWQHEGKQAMVRDGANQAWLWGSAPLPAGVGDRQLYRTANLMVTDLWRREGDAFFRRLYALIQADRAAGRYQIPTATPDEKRRLLRSYIDRAAGHDMAAFWTEWAMDPQMATEGHR